MDPLSLHVLGPLEVRGPTGAPVDLGGPQARTALARLILAQGHVVPVGEILDVLWGQRPPDSATGTLQSYVSRLRRALGPDGSRMLRHESGGYVLRVPPEQVDALRFARLAREGSALLAGGDHEPAVATLGEALALWRGPVLGDVDAEFARAAAARLDELRLGAMEDLYDAQLRAGRAGAVVADLGEAVRTSPLRERLRGLWALALYRSGRQADALAALEQGRRVLDEELGLDPSRELRELQARILSQDPALDPRADAAVTAPVGGGPGQPADPGPPVDPAPPPTPRRASDDGPGPAEGSRGAADAPDPEELPALIGRARETASITGALDEVLAGAGCRYVVIEGQPGIGKTRLAQELVRLARDRGVPAITAVTLEIGAAPAYGPWLQMLRSAAAAGWPLSTAASRFMEGSESVLGGTAPTALAGAVADEMARATRGFAEARGIVMLLEDLQWADPASLDLFALLGPRLDTAPVLVVATVRELEVGRDDAVVEALAQVARRPGTRRMSLRGLSIAESGRLLERTVGTAVADDVVAAVHARSEGNPFFTAELARMLDEQGTLDAAAARSGSVPTGVRDVLARRVARLPAATRTLMEAAAVLGREVDLELLAGVTATSLDAVLDDLEPALVVRLLEVPESRPGAVRFAHALVREALADGISPLRRARLHLRAADGITATAGQNDDTVEVIAEHLWHAAAVGAGGRAAVTLEAAAEVALKRQALLSAESLLTRAAGLYRAAGTEGGLAELRVLRQLGFVGAALHGYAVNADSALVRRARELARATERLDILLDLIWADWAGCDTGGQPARGERLVLDAEALVDGVDDAAMQGGVACMRAFTERHFGRMASARDHIDRAIALFRDSRVAHEAGFYLNSSLTAKGFRHWVAALVGDLDRAALEDDYLSQDLPFGRIVFGLFGAAAMLSAGDEDGLRVFAARMLAADPDMLLSFWSSSAELYSAISLLQRGATGEGLELLARGREHMRQAGGHTMLAGIYAGAGQALTRHGHLDRARDMVAAARDELATAGEAAYRPQVELAAAHLAAAEGDPATAERRFDVAEGIAVEHGSHGLVARIRRERAEVLGGQRAG